MKYLGASLLGAALVVVSGCTLPNSGDISSPIPTVASASVQHEAAPYPADVDHLADILSIAQAQLPEGARDVAVVSASKFAQAYPGGWGYVVSFTATDKSLRDFVDKYTIDSGALLDEYDQGSTDVGLDDIDFEGIENPLILSLATPPGNTHLVVERPLGGAWLIIREASR